MPLRHAVLVLLVAICAATPAPAGASSTLRRCLQACASDVRSCVALARTRTRTARSACTGSSSARAACRHAARAGLHLSVQSCHTLRKDCRACCRAGGQGPACPVGRPVGFEPPPRQDLGALGVPRQDDGSFFVLAIPNASLAIDPTRRDPVTALGACTGWIVACVDPASRSLDDCARSAPPCTSAQPWEEPACCPSACFAAYQERRRAGSEPLAAFSAVYFEGASCFPGVRTLLEGAR